MYFIVFRIKLPLVPQKNLLCLSIRFIHNILLPLRDGFTRLLLLNFCLWMNCRNLYLSNLTLNIFLSFEVICLHAIVLFPPSMHLLRHFCILRCDRSLSFLLWAWLNLQKGGQYSHLFHQQEHTLPIFLLLFFRWQKVNLFLNKKWSTN